MQPEFGKRSRGLIYIFSKTAVFQPLTKPTKKTFSYTPTNCLFDGSSYKGNPSQPDATVCSK